MFYNIELRKTIKTLMDASRKISENQLDFQIKCQKKNELGMLCDAFEDMRMTLCENNREMWKSLEERKRLNSAFSHDLRFGCIFGFVYYHSSFALYFERLCGFSAAICTARKSRSK